MEACEIIIPLPFNGTWTGYRNNLSPLTIQIPTQYRSPGMVYYVSSAEMLFSIRGTNTTDQWVTSWIDNPSDPNNQSLVPVDCFTIKSSIPGNVYDERQNKREVIAILTPTETDHNNQSRCSVVKYKYEADLEHATFIELGGNTEIKLRICFSFSDNDIDFINSGDRTIIGYGTYNKWIMTFGCIKLKIIPE